MAAPRGRDGGRDGQAGGRRRGRHTWVRDPEGAGASGRTGPAAQAQRAPDRDGGGGGGSTPPNYRRYGQFTLVRAPATTATTWRRESGRGGRGGGKRALLRAAAGTAPAAEDAAAPAFFSGEVDSDSDADGPFVADVDDAAAPDEALPTWEAVLATCEGEARAERQRMEAIASAPRLRDGSCDPAGVHGEIARFVAAQLPTRAELVRVGHSLAALELIARKLMGSHATVSVFGSRATCLSLRGDDGGALDDGSGEANEASASAATGSVADQVRREMAKLSADLEEALEADTTDGAQDGTEEDAADCQTVRPLEHQEEEVNEYEYEEEEEDDDDDDDEYDYEEEEEEEECGEDSHGIDDVDDAGGEDDEDGGDDGASREEEPLPPGTEPTSAAPSSYILRARSPARHVPVSTTIPQPASSHELSRDAQSALTGLGPAPSWIVGGTASDIDAVILNAVGVRTAEKAGGIKSKAEKLAIVTKLQQVRKALMLAGVTRKKEKGQVIATARVPLLKYKDKRTGCHVDLSIATLNGIAATEIVLAACRKYAALRPLILCTKRILREAGLNDVVSGGVGSYGIFALSLSFVKGRLWHEALRSGNSNPDEVTIPTDYSHLLRDMLRFLSSAPPHFKFDPSSPPPIAAGGRLAQHSGSSRPEARQARADTRQAHLSKLGKRKRPGPASTLYLCDPQDPERDIGINSYKWPLIQKAFANAASALTRGMVASSSLASWTVGGIMPRMQPLGATSPQFSALALAWSAAASAVRAAERAIKQNTQKSVKRRKKKEHGVDPRDVNKKTKKERKAAKKAKTRAVPVVGRVTKKNRRKERKHRQQ